MQSVFSKGVLIGGLTAALLVFGYVVISISNDPSLNEDQVTEKTEDVDAPSVQVRAPVTVLTDTDQESPLYVQREIGEDIEMTNKYCLQDEECTVNIDDLGIQINVPEGYYFRTYGNEIFDVGQRLMGSFQPLDPGISEDQRLHLSFGASSSDYGVGIGEGGPTFYSGPSLTLKDGEIDDDIIAVSKKLGPIKNAEIVVVHGKEALRFIGTYNAYAGGKYLSVTYVFPLIDLPYANLTMRFGSTYDFDPNRTQEDSERIFDGQWKNWPSEEERAELDARAKKMFEYVIFIR